MLEIDFRLQSAAGHQRVSDADGGSTSEGYSDVEIIIFLQKGTVNDVEKVALVLCPVFIGKPGGYLFQLVGKAVLCGNIIGFFQRLRHRGFMFRAVLPEIKLTGVFTPAGIGNIKHITQFRSVAAVIQESNSLGTTPNITAHCIVPEVIFRTGGSIGPLGENHHLLRERILIKPGCGGKKGRPPLVAASQPGGYLFGHLCIALQFTRHSRPPCHRSPGTVPVPQSPHPSWQRAFPARNR